MARDTKPYASEEVVERARAMADAFRAKDALVIYVRVLLSDFLTVPADQVTNRPADIPPQLSEITASAGMQPGDLLITKRHWSAFAGTQLEQELRSRGIDTIVIAGIATNIGVESTLRHGAGIGFAFITVEDACATFTAEMQKFAFTTIFPRLSKVRTTRQVLEAIASSCSE